MGFAPTTWTAPLLLAHCGGVFHYLAWRGRRPVVPDGATSRLSPHFVLGFMTKFVAVVFLPLAIGLTALSVAEHRRAFVRDWRAWASRG
jgi:hypothetical protein